MEGSLEHTFLMENAFGSVSHHLILYMLRCLEVPASFIGVCKELYSGNTQQILCLGGASEIPLRVGIKQGCPLSLILFNFALEALLPALREATMKYTLDNGFTVTQLAYADDLCILALEQHALFKDFSSWCGLNINVKKCGCLSSINNSKRGSYVELFTPTYDGAFGLPTARERLSTTATLTSSVVELAEKILASHLTEWQKVDAINLFAISKTNYVLHTSLVNRSWTAGLDSSLKKLVKRAFRLPVCTLGAFFHLLTRLGGLGLSSVESALEGAMVSRVLKTLISRDRLVSDVAWAQLPATVAKRMGTPPQIRRNLLGFLNTPQPPGESAKGNVKSLWSMPRRSLVFLDLKLDSDPDGRLTVALSTP